MCHQLVICLYKLENLIVFVGSSAVTFTLVSSVALIIIIIIIIIIIDDGDDDDDDDGGVMMMMVQSHSSHNVRIRLDMQIRCIKLSDVFNKRRRVIIERLSSFGFRYVCFCFYFECLADKHREGFIVLLFYHLFDHRFYFLIWLL